MVESGYQKEAGEIELAQYINTDESDDNTLKNTLNFH